MPDWPGVIEGDDTAIATSADRGPAVTVVGATELFAVTGSVVAVDTEAEPPVSAPGAVEEASDTGIATLADAPFASEPATVQVTVPTESVQPDGSVPPEAGTVTPDGGVYVNVVGPTASDGPPFVAVNVTVPDVPGVIVGDVTAMATSAERPAIVSVVGEVELFATFGSLLDVDTVALPPDTAPGVPDAGTDTGSVTEPVAPNASVPATLHVTVPEASVQPDGNVPSVTAEGAV